MNEHHTQASTSDASLPADVRRPEEEALIKKVAELLRSGKPQQGLEIIRRSNLRTPWVQNAVGVCCLRLGKAQPALDVFRQLALGPGGIILRADAPAVFKANFATALLSTSNFDGFMKTLFELKDDRHPAVQRLRDRVSEWKNEFTAWQRLKWQLGIGQPPPISLTTALGDLE